MTSYLVHLYIRWYEKGKARQLADVRRGGVAVLVHVFVCYLIYEINGYERGKSFFYLNDVSFKMKYVCVPIAPHFTCFIVRDTGEVPSSPVSSVFESRDDRKIQKLDDNIYKP